MAQGSAGAERRRLRGESEQTPQTLEAIKQLLTFVPIVLMSLAIVLARFYILDSALHSRIREELEAID